MDDLECVDRLSVTVAVEEVEIFFCRFAEEGWSGCTRSLLACSDLFAIVVVVVVVVVVDADVDASTGTALLSWTILVIFRGGCGDGCGCA